MDWVVHVFTPMVDQCGGVGGLRGGDVLLLTSWEFCTHALWGMVHVNVSGTCTVVPASLETAFNLWIPSNCAGLCVLWHCGDREIKFFFQKLLLTSDLSWALIPLPTQPVLPGEFKRDLGRFFHWNCASWLAFWREKKPCNFGWAALGFEIILFISRNLWK